MKDICIAHHGWGEKDHWQVRHFKTLRSNYARAPYWSDHAPWLESFYQSRSWKNLAAMNRAMLDYLLAAFEIETEVVVASECSFRGRKFDLVLEHARQLGAGSVVTGALGRDYIVADDFRREGVYLYFQRYTHPAYRQNRQGFEPFMWAFDLLLNHGPASRDILLQSNVAPQDLIAAARAEKAATVLEKVC